MVRYKIFEWKDGTGVEYYVNDGIRASTEFSDCNMEMEVSKTAYESD